MTRFMGTWRALAAPRRAVPLLLVALALLATEWLAWSSFSALIVDGALVLAFVAFMPASWRVLCADKTGVRGAIGLASFIAICATLVAALGVALPFVLGLRGTYVADPSALGLIVVLFAIGGWGLGRDIELERGLEAARRRAIELALEAERAQIFALRAHLDPHFLFNTLNAIAEWCRADPMIAEKATLELASMLRTILEAIRSPTWELAAELAFVRRLFELYEIRDRERYRFVLEVPDPVPDVVIPPMLLLPLVENAITHGPTAGHAGEVVLRVRASSMIEIEIRNPGMFTGRREGGEGIAMVERRLALAYGERARLSIGSEGASTIAKLALPTEVLA